MIRKVFIPTATFACALLVACGDDASTNATPTSDAGPDAIAPGTDTSGTDASTDAASSFALATEPTSVDAAYGAKVAVRLSIVRDGPVGDVALSLEDLPKRISATFDAQTVATKESATTLTLVIGDDAPLGASTLTIVGRWNDKEARVKLLVTVKTITVNGAISPSEEGVSVVLVDGARVTTKTGSDGSFAFHDVKPPYDLYTVRHSGAAGASISDRVVYYEGLTRPDPTIEARALSSGGIVPPVNKAKISGTLSGTAAPISTNNPVVFVWTGSKDLDIKVAGGNAYTIEPSWTGLSVGKTAGTVYALQSDNALGTWRGYAEGAVALANGGSATLDLVMTAPASAKVTGALTAPSGFPTPKVATELHFGAHAYRLGAMSAPPALDLSIPVVPSLAVSFLASSELGAAKSEVLFSGVKSALDITYALEAPPAMNAPAASTAANHTTSFAWTPPGDAASVVRWTVGKVVYELFTSGSEVFVPQIPEKSFSPDNATWTALSANVRETAPPPKFSVEGEQASSREFSNQLSPCITPPDGSDDQGQATEVYRRVQAADPQGGRCVRSRRARRAASS